MRLIDIEKCIKEWEHMLDPRFPYMPCQTFEQFILNSPTVNPYEWFPIEKRKPENKQKVLLLLWSNEIVVAEYVAEGDCFWDGQRDYLSTVNMWTALPEPPKESDE